jgi:hypothetical protein
MAKILNKNYEFDIEKFSKMLVNFCKKNCRIFKRVSQVLRFQKIFKTQTLSLNLKLERHNGPSRKFLKLRLFFQEIPILDRTLSIRQKLQFIYPNVGVSRAVEAIRPQFFYY